MKDSSEVEIAQDIGSVLNPSMMIQDNRQKKKSRNEDFVLLKKYKNSENLTKT